MVRREEYPEEVTSGVAATGRFTMGVKIEW
jgi:hypothetical protein